MMTTKKTPSKTTAERLHRAASARPAIKAQAKVKAAQKEKKKKPMKASTKWLPKSWSTTQRTRSSGTSRGVTDRLQVKSLLVSS